MAARPSDEPLWAVVTTPRELGTFIAQLRRGSHLTQAQLAESADVTRRFVNELEGGQTTLFVRRLYAVLEALDVRLVIEQRGARDPLNVVVAEAHTTGHGDVTAVRSADAPPDVESPGGPSLKELGW